MSFNDVMNIILPPILDSDRRTWSAVNTSGYGERTRNGIKKMHFGVDFAYPDDPTKFLTKNPPIYSPVNGKITMSGSDWGTIEITDNAGNRHQILHTDSQTVKVGQSVVVGQLIGTMGKKEADKEHVHYQIRDGKNTANLLDPENYWNERATPFRPV